MLEVEIKIKLQNLQKVKSILNDEGAQYGFTMKNIDIYYNQPQILGDFAKSDEALRLRITQILKTDTEEIIEETSDLTYKGPKMDPKIKTRIEHVCKLEDPNTMDKIVLALGYRKVITIEKLRQEYTFEFQGKSLEILIDQVEGLDGYYLEAELMAEEESEIPQINTILMNFLKLIQYDESALITDSYLELVLFNS